MSLRISQAINCIVSYCSDTFESNQEYDKHFLKEHSSLYCKSCSLRFVNKTSLNNHIQNSCPHKGSANMNLKSTSTASSVVTSLEEIQKGSGTKLDIQIQKKSDEKSNGIQNPIKTFTFEKKSSFNQSDERGARPIKPNRTLKTNISSAVPLDFESFKKSMDQLKISKPETTVPIKSEPRQNPLKFPINSDLKKKQKKIEKKLRQKTNTSFKKHSDEDDYEEDKENNEEMVFLPTPQMTNDPLNLTHLEQHIEKSDEKLSLKEMLLPPSDSKTENKTFSDYALLPESCISNPALSFGLLGQFSGNDKYKDVYMNIGSPFCMVACGVQGSGKSHSVATVIENCLLNIPSYIQVKKPISTLIFHFDQDENNMCEAVTLTSRRAGIPSDIGVVEKMMILVSPSFYLQRKEYYKNVPNCTVLPLLFTWSKLKSSQISALMHFDKAMPLYMSAIIELLRKFQKAGNIPDFSSFKKSVENLELSNTQTGPLNLRMALLESLVKESKENSHFPDTNLDSIFKETSLVIVDLTDPMMTSEEANGIFHVLLSMFMNVVGSKLCVFDEAHKYLQDNSPLSNAITTAVRQMRHHGLRMIVSSQSPKTIPSEILDLSTMILIHRFSAHDWFKYLQTKVPMNESYYETITSLGTGHALLSYGKWNLSFDFEEHQFVMPIGIRARITMDGGRSK